MNTSQSLARASLSRFLLCAVAFAAVPAWSQEIQLTPNKPNGVYAPGEKIVWDVKVSGAGADAVKSAKYRILKAGTQEVGQGTLDLSTGAAQIETTQTDPITYLTDLRAKGADGKDIVGWGGAVISPEKIQPALPRPADFDAFWAGKLDQLAKIPANPILTPEPSEKEGVDYSKITLDNINGTKVRGQIARPKVGEKFPAVIILQWAGVYRIPKNFVTGYASNGWLALNISAHDLPLDEAPEFYKQVGDTTLKNYATQGNDNRETSYMLRMLLGCVRAAQYLSSRPDWNGQTLVATGNSQGGYQSIALAGLFPGITAVSVGVPAGCDMAGAVMGRRTPWPYWTALNVTDANRAAVVEASRYYDPVNFAPKIKAPVLIGVGLIDNTSVPSGVFAMANSLGGAKEVVPLPLAEHQEKNKSHARYYERSGAWMNALRQNQTPPIAPYPPQ